MEEETKKKTTSKEVTDDERIVDPTTSDVQKLASALTRVLHEPPELWMEGGWAASAVHVLPPRNYDIWRDASSDHLQGVTMTCPLTVAMEVRQLVLVSASPTYSLLELLQLRIGSLNYVWGPQACAVVLPWARWHLPPDEKGRYLVASPSVPPTVVVRNTNAFPVDVRAMIVGPIVREGRGWW